MPSCRQSTGFYASVTCLPLYSGAEFDHKRMQSILQ